MSTNKVRGYAELRQAIETSDKSLEDLKDTYYCTYRDADTVVKILGAKENYFYMNSLQEMNDEDEANLHVVDGKSTFALCFCHSDTENIPLWYLYGGITGEGASIRLTVNKMRKFKNGISHLYPIDEKKTVRTSEPLNDKDFTMKADWVCYYKEVGDELNRKYIIKYRGKKYQISPQEWEQFRDGNYFIKKYPWNYEKEFRIVFRFKVAPSDMIAVPFPKEAVLEGLSVRVAPNFSEEISSYAMRVKLKPEKVCKSKMGVNFNLLKGNNNVILRNFENIVNESAPDQRKKMCSVLQEKKACIDEKIT